MIKSRRGLSLDLPSPSQLNADHALLLHRKPPGEKRSLSAYHASTAAVIDAGRFFITTPFPDLTLYNPVLIVDGMRMRKDFRFGLDDYVQWPQKWDRSLCHLACILRVPSDDHPWSLMWWTPTSEYFVLERSCFTTGLGRLQLARSMEIRKIARELLERSDMFCRTHKNETEVSLAVQLGRQLSDRLNRLEFITVSYRQMCTLVASVQRLFLELHALLEYCDVYKPRMEGSVATVSTPAAVIGAFTWDLDDATLLFRAGIPFWFIHSHTDIGRVAVSSLAPVSEEGDVCCQENQFPSDIVFRGVPNLRVQYSAIHACVDEVFKTFSPFNSCNASGCDFSSATLTDIGPDRSRRVVEHRSRPYTRPPTKVSGVHRHIGHFLSNQFLPPFAPSWSWAYGRVFTANPPHNKQTGFAFPDPLLFVAVQSTSKMYTYCFNWLRFRDLLIFRLTKPSPSLISNVVWRQLLSGDFIPKEREDGEAESLASVRKAEVRSLLANCLTESGVEVDLDHLPESVRWRDSEFSQHDTFSSSVVQEIFFEISMLNFRCELVAVDSALTLTHLQTDGHRSLVYFCIFGRCNGDILSVDMSSSSQGIAAKSPVDRLPYVFALRDVMLSWSGSAHRCRAISNVSRKDVSDCDVYEPFERNVVLCYLQAAFDCFGRAAVAPVRLDKIPCV
ncbi:hypothetical protein K435DRAFT_864266 [Dendrothele bispora CBS 962.96]|uniref:Uncharacterized protein n=1 Tax=Dendrothele bispora (strain CBS 962.96) TaxID=1314807 RepID=A0A4S8LMJ6_DENBC|nr:hypothetical protein K435DRAFT_864266 [Dendrothele bispora CBS 962.96]